MSAISTYFYSIFHSLYTVVVGMRITIKHLFTRSATVQYPTVKMKIPERARNRLYVNIDDCIGCDQCSMACPVDCIVIDTIKSTPDIDLGLTSKNTKKRLYVPRFDIDIAKCCYCGLCVWPCPTDCIVMTDVYEFSEYDRKNLIYSFSNMTAEEIVGAKERLKKYDEEQAAKKAAMSAAASAKDTVPMAQPPPKPESPAR
jgi:NADH-quinone oxidoreductase subunit I